MQTKKIKTINDHINESRSEMDLLRLIAVMLSIQTKEVPYAFREDDLRHELMMAMIDYAHEHKSEIANYEVTVSIGDRVESSTFRSMKVPGDPSLGYLVENDMNLQEYCDKIVRPVSAELAARVLAACPDVSPNLSEYGLDVHHA